MHPSRRPSASLIVAVIALVAALAGSAVALPGTNSVKGNDVAKNSIKGKHVKADKLKGGDIDESTLGEVPAAATAQTAANGAARVSYKGAVGSGVQTILDTGGLVLKADCTGADELVLTMESTVDNAAVFAESHDHDGTGNANGDTSNDYEQQGDFDAGQPVAIDGDNLHSDDGQGLEINYSNPDGTEVFVKLQNWLAGGNASAPAACFVGGVAFVV
jgi:hypothetical protein